MTYVLVINARGKVPGVPTFMNAMLHEQFYADGDKRPMQYDWVCNIDTIPSRGAPLDFPDELWLVSRDRKYDFDVHFAHSGVFVSDAFLKLLPAGDVANFKVAKVHAVNKKNESISTKDLFFIKFNKILRGADRKKIKFIQQRMFGKLLSDSESRPSIAYVRELHLDNKQLHGLNFFILSDLSGNNAFVSSDLAEKMQSSKLKGVDYIDLGNYSEVEEYKIRDVEREYKLEIKDIPNFEPGAS